MSPQVSTDVVRSRIFNGLTAEQRRTWMAGARTRDVPRGTIVARRASGGTGDRPLPGRVGIPQDLAGHLRCGRPGDAGVVLLHALTRQELAALTGTTLYTVSRTLSQWTADGILGSDGRRLVIRDRARLERLAG
jgi:CRP-like cAMP-binding protein